MEFRGVSWEGREWEQRVIRLVGLPLSDPGVCKHADVSRFQHTCRLYRFVPVCDLLFLSSRSQGLPNASILMLRYQMDFDKCCLNNSANRLKSPFDAVALLLWQALRFQL